MCFDTWTCSPCWGYSDMAELGCSVPSSQMAVHPSSVDQLYCMLAGCSACCAATGPLTSAAATECYWILNQNAVHMASQPCMWCKSGNTMDCLVTPRLGSWQWLYPDPMPVRCTDTSSWQLLYPEPMPVSCTHLHTWWNPWALAMMHSSLRRMPVISWSMPAAPPACPS